MKGKDLLARPEPPLVPRTNGSGTGHGDGTRRSSTPNALFNYTGRPPQEQVSYGVHCLAGSNLDIVALQALGLAVEFEL